MTLSGQRAPAGYQHRLSVPTGLPWLFPSRGPPPGGPTSRPTLLPILSLVEFQWPIRRRPSRGVGGGADWRSLKSPLQRARPTRLLSPGGDRACPTLLPLAPQLRNSAAPQSYTMSDSRDPASDQMKQWKEQRAPQVPCVPQSLSRTWAAASNGAGSPPPPGGPRWGCTTGCALGWLLSVSRTVPFCREGMGLPACWTCRWQQGPGSWLRVWHLCQLGHRSQLEGDAEPPGQRGREPQL